MKTKHRLKLLTLLREGSEMYDNLKKSLYLEAMSGPTFKAKYEPIQEAKDPDRLQAGDEAEIIGHALNHGFNNGVIVKILGDSEHNSKNYKITNKNNNKVRYASPQDLKKLPKQEQTPKEFKVGDMVKIIDKLNHSFKIDQIVKVIEPIDKYGLIMCISDCSEKQFVEECQIEHI